MAEPMAEPNVFPVQTQVVRQTRVVPLQTISANRHTVIRHPVSQHTKLVIVELAQMIIRVMISPINIGVLIAASFVVTAINEVAEFYNENGAEYENAGSYRAAAGWLIFVTSAAIIYHFIAVIILVLYISSTVKQRIKLFTVLNSISCVVFILAFLAGGIVNAVYAAENDYLHIDLCDDSNTDDDEFCDNLETVAIAEAACAVLSGLSMMCFGVLVCVTPCTCMEVASTSSSYYGQPQVGPTHQSTNMSAYPSPNTSQYGQPCRPSYPSASTSQYPSPSAPAYPPTQHVSPSAPYNPISHQSSHIPSSAPLNSNDNASADLPSYEVALHYKVLQPAPSGEPPEESKTTPVP